MYAETHIYQVFGQAYMTQAPIFRTLPQNGRQWGCQTHKCRPDKFCRKFLTWPSVCDCLHGLHRRWIAALPSLALGGPIRLLPPTQKSTKGSRLPANVHEWSRSEGVRDRGG